MTDNPHRIGNIPIPVFEEVEISSSQSSEEKDIIGKESNVLLEAEDGGEEVEISFVLYPYDHPLDLDVSEQVSDVKRLTELDAEENEILYEGIDGAISVDSVSINDNSDEKIIRRGTITGQFLPHPREIYFGTLIGGDYLFELKTEPNGNVINSVEGVQEFEFQATTLMNDINGLDGENNFEFGLGDGFGRDFGKFFGTNTQQAVQINRGFVGSGIGSDFTTEGDMVAVATFGPFGRNFGRKFGG